MPPSTEFAFGTLCRDHSITLTPLSPSGWEYHLVLGQQSRVTFPQGQIKMTVERTCNGGPTDRESERGRGDLGDEAEESRRASRGS